MGQRAFPKLDVKESEDLSWYLRTPEELPRPFSSESLFGRVAPLELEIGCGKGLFIQGATGERPEHDFMGIEIGKKYATFTALRLCRSGRKNGMIVAGDAVPVLREILPENSLFAVHVYFPDPWWKRAHRQRRVLREEVLKLIESRLQPGGTFHFWTDVQEYFESTLKWVREKTGFSEPIDIPEVVAEHDMDYHTHFERRTRLHGEAVYRVRFLKRGEL